MLFRKLPLIVGRESDLPEAGRFFTLDAAGVPLLLTRDPWGTAHAMINLCRHRGTRLVSAESGTATTFVCPYHAWTYDLCGRLGTVALGKCLPMVDQPREESALVELPLETHHGFLWCLPTARATLDVASTLGPLDAELEARDAAHHVVAGRSTTIREGNWKEIMEGFLGDPQHRLVFPSSILMLDAEGISHVALYPHAQDETTIVHTRLAPPGATAEAPEPSLGTPAVDEARVRAFHEAIDRTVAAHPIRRL